MSYSQKAVDKWQKENVKRYTLAFMVKSDAAIIEKLSSVPNRTDYIRQLILKDLLRS